MTKYGIGFVPFAFAAEILLSKVNVGTQHLSTDDPIIKSQATRDVSLFFPSATLYAFAAELALKAAIVSLHFKPPRSHDLWKLFSALPSDRANRFKKQFNDTNFDEKLFAHRAIFEESRYFFEEKMDGSNFSCDVFFMKKLTDTLLSEFAVELQDSANGLPVTGTTTAK